MIEKKGSKPHTFIDVSPNFSKMIPIEGHGNMMGLEEIEALVTVMKERVYTWGRFIEEFETEFAKFLGVRYAFAVSSCTGALEIATKLLKIEKGDEVIVPAITFIATSLSCLEQGARIVFADIDPQTYNIDPDDVKRKITRKTKAIYLVHLDGQPAEMDEILSIAKKHGIYVVEDCAHAPGAEYKGRKVGSIGNIGCFSFHARKNMSTLGEGGMITTNNRRFGENIHVLRCIGHTALKRAYKNKFGDIMEIDLCDVNGQIPSHYRMNDFQAAVGLVQLRKLKIINSMREEIFMFYSKEISSIEGITPPYIAPDRKCSYHRYTCLYDSDVTGVPKQEFKKKLLKNGVECSSTYLPNYLYQIYRKRGYGRTLCPGAEEFYKKSLMLPIYPELTRQHQEKVISAISKSLNIGR